MRSVTPNAGGARLEIEATTVLDDAELGASIAVNGCCLTVVALGDGSLGGRRGHRDARPHEPRRPRAPATRVNLERPVRLADRLGGHLVQGHVDATGTVRAREPQPDGSTLVTLRRARRRAALRRAQGLDHRRRHQPHRRARVHDDGVRGRA